MDDSKLFNGIGMVIDDHVMSKEGDQIVQIVDYLENTKGLPLIKYTSLPEFSDATYFMGIKFILLDWDLKVLSAEDDELPIGIPQLQEDNKKENIEFLQKILSSLVVPIFIFSHNTVEDIQRYLIDGNLMDENNKDKVSIFVKSKSDLFDENRQCIMFDVVKEWFQSMPAMYVVNKWKMEYMYALNSMALDMKGASEYWPNILWKCYKDDGVNPSEEIVAVISQNVLSRIQPVEFDEKILGIEQDCSPNSLNNVLSKNCFIENEFLGDTSSTGEVYLEDKKYYYINIRPMCDCVDRNGNSVVYLLSGTKLTNSKVKNNYSTKYGKFNEQANTAIVGPIGDKFIEFRFKDLLIVDFETWKDKRIGRVIPPYVTYVAQKYGLYVHRQGLPRLPKEIIPNLQADTNVGNEDNDLKKQLSNSKKQIEKLTAKIAAMEKSKQHLCRWQNCKVIIAPSLKKRKFRK